MGLPSSLDFKHSSWDTLSCRLSASQLHMWGWLRDYYIRVGTNWCFWLLSRSYWCRAWIDLWPCIHVRNAGRKLLERDICRTFVGAYRIDLAEEASVPQGNTVGNVHLYPVLAVWQFLDHFPCTIPAVWMVTILVLHSHTLVFVQLRKLLAVLVVVFYAFEVSLPHCPSRSLAAILHSFDHCRHPHFCRNCS